MRNVLGRCEARDGQAHLSDRPRLVLEDEVDELIDVMCDPDRHGPAFVAGAAPTEDQDAWVERIGRATHQTVGLGATYVLSEGAAVGLREQVGIHHAVPHGAVRTYLPEVDPASLVDARRHRLMTARTFELNDTHRTTRTLAAAARRATLGRPLPKLVARVDQVLKGAEPDLVSEWAARSAAGVSAPRRTGVAPVDSVPVGAAEVVTDATRTAMRVAETETQHEVLAVVPVSEGEAPGTILEQTDVFALAVRDLVAEFAAPIGELEIATEGPVDPVVLQEQLLTLLLAGRSSALSQRELRRRLDDLQTAVAESEEAREEQAALLEDEQLANAETQDELRRVLRDRERLRLLVAQSDSGAAWDEDHSEPESPESFTELLEWWAEGRLTGVVWTGDDSVTQALDDNDPLGTWAGRAWDALRALSGYYEVCAQAEGFAGGVHQYLKETPAGYPGFSANKHVPVESQTVLTNQKWRAERVLPVPTDVCPEGQVLMQSHMRIGARSTIAPRLHYYDDTSGTGKVYVGYLGRHLHNTKTN
ncbi:hypothetical protein BJF86_15425 [Serinicoccus sp. CNJ-927]|nr:hypothetical protein BJF86_15425 [Serinicoccus sp. CNJ-927]